MADNEREDDAEGVVGATAGGAGGALLGTVMGAVLGGPVGAAIGAGIGTLAGSAVGYAVDYGSHEADFRHYHDSDPARVARHPFDQASTAYRYGWEVHDRPEFHDKTYDHIRTDLQKGWTGSGDFADFEPYVKHSYERRSNLSRGGSFAQAAKE